MYGVELYAAVRLAVVDEGLSHHEAGRRFGIDRRTVKKMLSYSAPPGYRRTKPVRRPKLDGFTGIVDAILEADTDPDVPRKQRHTAHRIFERLRDEHGFTGGSSTRRRIARSHGSGSISCVRFCGESSERKASRVLRRLKLRIARGRRTRRRLGGSTAGRGAAVTTWTRRGRSEPRDGVGTAAVSTKSGRRRGRRFRPAAGWRRR